LTDGLAAGVIEGLPAVSLFRSSGVWRSCRWHRRGGGIGRVGGGWALRCGKTCLKNAPIRSDGPCTCRAQPDALIVTVHYPSPRAARAGVRIASSGSTFARGSRTGNRQKVICTAKEADAIDQERTLRQILGNPLDLEKALHTALRDADPWKRLHLQALFARSQKKFDEAWELYNQCRSVLSQQGSMGAYRNITHEMVRQLWAEGKQKEAICMIAEVSYWDLKRSEIPFLIPLALRRAGPRHHQADPGVGERSGS